MPLSERLVAVGANCVEPHLCPELIRTAQTWFVEPVRAQQQQLASIEPSRVMDKDGPMIVL